MEWLKRYKHAKSVRDCWCKSVDIPIPKDKTSYLLSIPDNYWRKFNSTKFFSLFNELGHSSIDFDKCICNSKVERKRK